MDSCPEMRIPSNVQRSDLDRPSPRIASAVLNSLVLLAAVILSIWAMRPPEPVPASAPPGVFSAERAMRYLRGIAHNPHPTGTAANQKVREYLLSELNQFGIPDANTIGHRLQRVSRMAEWYQRGQCSECRRKTAGHGYDSVRTAGGALRLA